MKVSLERQIDAVREAVIAANDYKHAIELDAAFSTLKWVERHQAELRVLGEFPIENMEIRCVVRRDEE
jgi:hypothetical protein